MLDFTRCNTDAEFKFIHFYKKRCAALPDLNNLKKDSYVVNTIVHVSSNYTWQKAMMVMKHKNP